MDKHTPVLLLKRVFARWPQIQRRPLATVVSTTSTSLGAENRQVFFASTLSPSASGDVDAECRRRETLVVCLFLVALSNVADEQRISGKVEVLYFDLLVRQPVLLSVSDRLFVQMPTDTVRYSEVLNMWGNAEISHLFAILTSHVSGNVGVFGF